MYDCTYEAYEYLKVSSKGLVGWLVTCRRSEIYSNDNS